jgi:gamma-tubulin complex component 6
VDEIEVENSIVCVNLSSSVFSSYHVSTGEAKCSPEVLSYQTSSCHNGTNPANPNNENLRDSDLTCNNVPMHSQNMEHNVMPDARDLDYQYSKFWPFGKFPKNTSNSSPGQMCLVDEFLYTDVESAVEQVSYDVVCPSHGEKSGTMTSSWNTSVSYNLNSNPILKNAIVRHTESDLEGKRKNRALASFVFDSVTNPCEVYCGRSRSCLFEPEAGAGAAVILQSTAQICKQSDCSSNLPEAKTGSQGCIALSGEIAARDNLLENVCGGAMWEKLLEYTAKSTEKIAGDSSSASDMPLDIAIDKCIIQEVLLQYPSCFL